MTSSPQSDSPTFPGGALWRDRDYVRFWAARVVVVAGSAVTAVAMPLLVLDLSGSALLTASVTALQVAPYLVLGLLAGAFADRLPRRRVMVSAELVAAAALVSVPVVDAVGRLTVGHLLAVTTVVATSFVWFDAAAFGTLPALVGRERLAEANSALWSATTLVGVAGPALGGLVVALVGPSTALALDATTYVAAAGLISLVVRPLGPSVAPRAAPTRLRDDVRDGLHFVVGHPLVRALTLVGALNAVAAGAVSGLIVVLVVDEMGVAADGRWVGVLFAVAGLGAFLAALALPRLARLPVGRVTLGSLALGVPAVLGLAAAPGPGSAVVPLLVWSGCTTLVVLNGINARQLATPDHLQARVNTTARMVAWGGTPVGALVAGALASPLGTRAALAGAVAAVLLALVAGLLSGLGRRRLVTAVQTC